jgi:hypothetical protein
MLACRQPEVVLRKEHELGLVKVVDGTESRCNKIALCEKAIFNTPIFG